MIWHAALQHKPHNGQEVLLSVAGSYYLAIYDEVRAGYILKDSSFLPEDSPGIEWTKLIPPTANF